MQGTSTSAFLRAFTFLLLLASASTSFAISSGSSLSGVIAVPGQEDTYTFSASAGDSFTVSLGEYFDLQEGGTAWGHVQVFYPDGSLLDSDYNRVTRNSTPQSGTYTIIVSSWHATGVGSYDLHFVKAPGSVENGSLTSGSSVSGSLSLGDLESFTFNANAGDSFTVSLAEYFDTTAGGTAWGWIRVYYPDGSLLDSDYNRVIRNSTPQSGTYTVVVASWHDTGTGNYDLHFVKAPGSVENAALVSGTQVSGALTLGDLESYTFDANAGDSFTVSLAEYFDTLAGGTAWGWVRVYYPDGSLLDSDYNRITRNSTPQTGTYTVVVASWHDTGTGNFDLHFVKAPGAVENGALSNGSGVTGSLSLGDLESYTFEATAGDSFTVSLAEYFDTPGGGTAWGWVRVYYPDGSLVDSDYDTVIRNATPQTGTYTVLIASWHQTGTGSFTLEFLRNSPVNPSALSYAALGDSYSSGEGVWPYLDAGDGLLSGCHRSTRAYSTQVRIPGNPLTVAADAGSNFDLIACSGAVTNNVTANGSGQNDEPTQLDPSRNVDASRDLVTITIGGNDAQFLALLVLCFAHDSCNTIMPFAPHSSVELGDFFDLLVAIVEARLLALHEEIRMAAPNATILVMGYPQLVSGLECSAAQVPGFPDLKLSATEQSWMRGATGRLNDAIQVATIARGLHFVPVEDHFSGHEVCGQYDDWVAGLLPFNPKGSFHPTARGQAEYAKAINAYLESIRVGWPFGYHASGLPVNPPPLLGGLLSSPGAQASGGGGVSSSASTSPIPGIGELTVTFSSAPASCDAAQDVIAPNTAMRIQGDGFAASEAVTLKLAIAGDQTYTLGSTAADASGAIDTVVTAPATILPGAMGTVEAVSAGLDGVGYMAFTLVSVQSATTLDTDADGVPDACDNCPSNSNASQADNDLDGIGNACDACADDADNDVDGDGVCGNVDSCPLDPDNDSDSDGFCANEDNCATLYNQLQADSDGNGIGDVCESLACYDLSLQVQSSGDGDIQTQPSNCGAARYFESTGLNLTATARTGQFFTGWTGDLQSAVNPLPITISANTLVTANFCSDPTDTDGDMIGDVCDNCPDDANSDQLNTDGDALGNVCDQDDDNDGLMDIYETGTGVFVSATDTGSDPLSVDSDGDGIFDGDEVQLGTDPNTETPEVAVPIAMIYVLILGLLCAGLARRAT